MRRLRSVTLALAILPVVASASDLVATKPGVMCLSAAALAKLTNPEGSSRSAGSVVSAQAQSIKADGGCVDIQIGSRVSAISTRRNTSIVSFDDGRGPKTYYVPNVDFTMAAGAATAAAPPQIALGDTAQSALVPTSEAPQTNPSNLFKATLLEPDTAAFLYAKLSGQRPDFETYAEQSETYKRANQFDREGVLKNEEARLVAFYDRLNVNSVFVMHINAALTDYSESTKGYAVQWADNVFVPLVDPSNNSTYKIAFQNADQFVQIPTGGSDEARAFARRYNLNTQAGATNGVTWEVVFRFTQAFPPTAPSEENMSANIVGARVISQSGNLMYTFQLSDADSSSSENARPQPADLSVRNVGLGMSYDAADDIGKKNWELRRFEVSVGFYINGFKNDHYSVTCGPLNDMSADERAHTGPMGFRRDFTDCMAFRLSREAPNGVVTEVASDQFVNTPLASIKQALIKRYGTPARVSGDSSGTSMTWAGKSGSEMAELVARVDQVDANLYRIDLHLTPNFNLKAKLEPPATVQGGPKL